MLEIKTINSGSDGNCYLISSGGSRLLLECGLTMQKIRKGADYGVSGLDGVLVSHEHKDHCKAVEDIMRAGVDCYMSAGTAEALGIDGHRLHTVQDREQAEVGEWFVVPFAVEHDAKEPLGFLLSDGTNKILYATDTAYIKPRFRGLTHILLEANYDREVLDENCRGGVIPQAHKIRVMRSHMSLQTVVEFLEVNDLSKVEAIHLLHMSRDNIDPQTAKERIQGVTGLPTYIAGGGA